jgi:hypothetical protein
LRTQSDKRGPPWKLEESERSIGISVATRRQLGVEDRNKKNKGVLMIAEAGGETQ